MRLSSSAPQISELCTNSSKRVSYHQYQPSWITHHIAPKSWSWLIFSEEHNLLQPASEVQRSQFIYQQSLHKPYANQPGSTKPPNCLANKTMPTINPATGQQVCYYFKRHQGCSYATACKYDNVCIKPQCLGDHPQWQNPPPLHQTPKPKLTLTSRNISQTFSGAKCRG